MLGKNLRERVSSVVRHARSREGLEWEHEHRVTPDFLLVLLGTRQSVNAQIYVGRLCYTHSLDHSETRQHYQDQGSLLTVKSNRNRGAFHLRSASGHTRRHHLTTHPNCPPWLSHLYTPAQCEPPDASSSSLQPCAATSGPQHPHPHPPQQSKESQRSTMSSASAEAQLVSLSSQLSAHIL